MSNVLSNIDNSSLFIPVFLCQFHIAKRLFGSSNNSFEHRFAPLAPTPIWAKENCTSGAGGRSLQDEWFSDVVSGCLHSFYSFNFGTGCTHPPTFANRQLQFHNSNTLNIGPSLHKDYHLLMRQTSVILTQILNFFFMRASMASWSSSEKANK